jgi:hypothetical protein
MKKLIVVAILAVIVLITFAVRITEHYHTTGFYFTADQPPTSQPGKKLWQSFYAWAQQNPSQVQPRCLERSFRCSLNLRINDKHQASIQSYITYSYFHKDVVNLYYLTEHGWKKEKSYLD